jgi:hypothetical protein
MTRSTRITQICCIGLDANAAPILGPIVIEIERSPSHPLPDFYVDIGLVEDLRPSQTLRDSTALTIEQLEQLRATCLGKRLAYSEGVPTKNQKKKNLEGGISIDYKRYWF